MRTLFSIWIKPLKTFEYLENLNYKDLNAKLNVIFYLGSLSLLIPHILEFSTKYESASWLEFVIGLLIGTLGATIIIKYIFAYIFKLIGNFLQGSAKLEQIRIVLAYTMTPWLINLAIASMLLIIALITKEYQILGYQNSITQYIIWIFVIRILIYGIASFNKFSYGIAVLNIVLAMGIIQGTLIGIKSMIN